MKKMMFSLLALSVIASQASFAQEKKEMSANKKLLIASGVANAVAWGGFAGTQALIEKKMFVHTYSPMALHYRPEELTLLSVPDYTAEIYGPDKYKVENAIAFKKPGEKYLLELQKYDPITKKSKLLSIKNLERFNSKDIRPLMERLEKRGYTLTYLQRSVKPQNLLHYISNTFMIGTAAAVLPTMYSAVGLYTESNVDKSVARVNNSSRSNTKEISSQRTVASRPTPKATSH